MILLSLPESERGQVCQILGVSRGVDDSTGMSEVWAELQRYQLRSKVYFRIAGF